MYWLYLLPYAVLTSFLGVIGGALAVVVVALGLLRLLFLGVLLMTGDVTRLKQEQTEGLSVVIEKFKALGNLLKRSVK